MKLPEDPRERKAAIIAAAVTFGMAVIILVLLFIFTLTTDRREMAYASEGEIQDEEEIYLEPELMILDSSGEPDATENDAPAPAAPGIPDYAEEIDTQQEFHNTDQPKEQALPVQKQPTVEGAEGVPAPEPKPSDEKDKPPKGPTGVKLNWNQGSGNKASNTSGAGGDGIGKVGDLPGRKFNDCPTIKPKGEGPVTIKVRMGVNADGKVVPGSATIVSSSGSVSADDIEKSLEMAANSTWEPKKGAAIEYGTITFTISHK